MSEVKNVLAEMLLRIPRQEIPASTLEAYAKDLADIPLPELQQVCQHLWLTEEWWPGVSKIRTTWGELDTANDENGDLKWTERRMSRLGRGEAPNPYSSMVREPGEDEYPNAVCREAVKLFGWRNLYDTKSERLGSEWHKHYQQARKNVITRKVAAPSVPISGDALGMGEAQALKAGS